MRKLRGIKENNAGRKHRGFLRKTAVSLAAAIAITFSTFAPRTETIIRGVPAARAMVNDPLLFRSIKRCIKDLKSRKKFVRSKAALALWKIARFKPENKELPKAIPALVKAMDDSHWQVKMHAHDAFVEIAKKCDPTDPYTIKAVPVIVKVLANKSGDVQVSAVDLLRKVTKANHEDGALLRVLLPALVKALNSRNSKIQVYAADALRGIELDRRQGQQFLRILVPALVKASNSRNKLVQRYAAEALIETSTDNPRNKEVIKAVPALIRILMNGTESLRIKAAGAFEEIKDRMVIPALVKALGDRSSKVKSEVAEVIVGIAVYSKSVPPELLKALPLLIKALNERSVQLRVNAVEAIRHISMGADHEILKKVIPALIKATTDKNESVRSEAAQSIRVMSRKGQKNTEVLKAIPSLIKLTKDRDPYARWNAVWALAQISIENPQDKKVKKIAAPALLKILKRRDGVGKDWVAIALVVLRRISFSRLRRMLHSNREFDRLAAASAISYIPELYLKKNQRIINASFAALIKTLRDRSPLVRMKAAKTFRILAYSGDSARHFMPYLLRAVPALARASKDKEFLVRIDSVAAIDRILHANRKNKKVLKALHSALRKAGYYHFR